MKERRLLEAFRREFEATRDLEAAVNAVARTARAYLTMQADPPPAPPAGPVNLTVTVVHKYAEPEVAGQAPGDALTMRAVDLAARAFGTTSERLCTRRWRKKVRAHTRGRWVAAALLRNMGLSLTASCRVLGLANHTSLVYGLNVLEQDQELLAVVARLWGELKAQAGPELRAAVAAGGRVA